MLDHLLGFTSALRPLFLLSGREGANSCLPLPPPLTLPEGFRRTVCAKRPADWEALQTFLGSELPWERAIEGRRVAQWGARYDYEQQCVDLRRVEDIPKALRSIFPEVGESVERCSQGGELELWTS